MSELVTQNQLQEVVVNGSEVLQAGELRVQKALTIGEKLIAEIQEKGMTAELDERANKFIVNCRNAKTEIEAQRKPITSFFDSIRKRFTELESKLDPKNAGVAAQVQKFRDDYVRKLRQEEEERKRKAQAKLDHDNEIIEIKSLLEKQLSEHVQRHIFERKQKLQNSFNNINLENYGPKAQALKLLEVDYDRAHFDSFSGAYVRKHTTQEEVTALLNEFMDSKDFNLIKAVVVQEITNFKKELIEKLPSLKKSLDEMAQADAEQQKRLADEKAKREADAEAKIKADADAKIKADAEAAERAKAAEQTNAMLDNMVLENSVAPETRDGYSINILNKAGVAEVFAFWFQKEGVVLTIAEIEKKSIAQMKAYCEKVAHKSGEKIVSDNLVYMEFHKAVNRK